MFGKATRRHPFLCGLNIIIFLVLCTIHAVSTQTVIANHVLSDALRVILTSPNSELDGGPVTEVLSTLETDEQEETTLPDAIRTVIRHTNRKAKRIDHSKSKYRTLDGTGNNIKRWWWGAALRKQRRILPVAYDDGRKVPRYRGLSGSHLPSARKVSLACFPPDKEDSPFLDENISQMFMQWGQYIDHDMILTDVEEVSACCKEMRPDGTHPDMFEKRVSRCFPILIEPGDRFFKPNCMGFKRSLGMIYKGIRQQLNTATSFIDASTVYGTSDYHSDQLRIFYNGLLDTSENNYLPLNDIFMCKLQHPKGCTYAGDPRVSVFPGLMGLHLTFHRQHNRMAEHLAAFNPHWDDETLFQEARKINAALHQLITFDHYLPMLLGDEVMALFEMNKPYQYCIDEHPEISNVFGAAAYRYGHSQINRKLFYGHKDRHDNISDVFFKPLVFFAEQDKTLADGLSNQCRREAQKVDKFFSTDVSDKLFMNVNAEGESFDLTARNVQRGRDHGLMSYTEFVKLVSKFDRKPFKDLKPVNISCLEDAGYESLEDVDVFVGGLHEEHVKDGLVGPVFAYILGEQFHRLKFADRYYFENNDTNIGFTPKQLESIKTQSLSTMLCHNTEIEFIQPNALAMPEPRNNEERPCSEYPDIDFSLWKEEVESVEVPDGPRAYVI